MIEAARFGVVLGADVEDDVGDGDLGPVAGSDQRMVAARHRKAEREP